jgi:hypothetical protein
MARTLTPKAVFVLNAIGITAAIALSADYFRLSPPAFQLLPASLSEVYLPFFSLDEASPSRR